MPELTEAQMKQQMDKNELGTLYFLYGAEKYTLKRAAKRLIKKCGTENFPEFNLNQFSNDATMEQIVDAAVAVPLMAERKCVAVSDFNVEDKNAAELKRLQEIIENVPETTTLVFYYPTLLFEGKRSAKWKKWLTTVSKNGYAVEYCARKPAELEKLMIREAEKAGCGLSKRNAACLVDYVGTDMKSLLNEMEKLCAFAAGQEITADMIEAMVTKSMETTVFILSAELIAGNYEKALSCMDELFYRREEPVGILAALSSTYVDMYRVRVALQSGKSYRAPVEYGEYRGKEFRLSKAERALKGISLEALRKTLELLLETDGKLKSSGTDPRILMDTLVARLLLLSREVQG